MKLNKFSDFLNKKEVLIGIIIPLFCENIWFLKDIKDYLITLSEYFL